MKFTRLELALILVLFVPCLWIGILYNVDFIVLYDTMKLLVQGEWTRIYSGLGENGSIGRYFYGPFSLVLYGPLGFLNYHVAKGIWLFFQSVSYFLFWWLLGRLFPVFTNAKAFWVWMLVWVLAVNPLHNNFQSNNIQIFLAVMLIGAEYLSRSEKSRDHLIAGFLITTAGAIKIFPFFIFGFYWLARPKLRKGLLISLIVTTISPFLVFGPATGTLLYKAFLKNLTSYGNENSFIKIDDINCLPSLIARTLHSFGVSEAAADPVIKLAIIGISGLFLFYVFLRRLRLGDPRYNDYYDSLWTMALTLMAFLNPSTRPHYYIFYVPALAWLAKRIFEGKIGKAETALTAASVVLIALTQEGVVGKSWNNWLEAHSIPTYGMLLLCLLTARQMTKTSIARN